MLLSGKLNAQHLGTLQFMPLTSNTLSNQTPVKVQLSTLPQAFIGFINNQGLILDSIPAGICNASIYISGYHSVEVYEIQIEPGKTTVVQETVFEASKSLDTVWVVSTPPFQSPVMLLTWNELYRMPGTALDLTKAMQSYPGVLPKPGFGYHLSFNGGASFENAYYLDGFPISTLNHFAVQGASGGPNALINMDFVKQMSLSSHALESEIGNALSAVVRIEQREARSDRWGGRLTQGGTDYGIMLEGPLGHQTGLQVSARNSFSQYYLKAFNVPVLPTYRDLQFRLHTRFKHNSDLLVTGIGGWDSYALNSQGRSSDALLYNIGYIPQGTVQAQMAGVRYRYFTSRQQFIVQASLDNTINKAQKYKNNSGLSNDLNLNYSSIELKQYFKIQHEFTPHQHFKFITGINTTQSNLYLKVWQRQLNALFLPDTFYSESTVPVRQWSCFAKLYAVVLNNRLHSEFFVRSDYWNVSSIKSPFQILSPSVKLTYKSSHQINLQGSYEINHQMPPAISLLYNRALNSSAAVKPVQSQQTQLLLEYQKSTQFSSKLSVFYKVYNFYPMLAHDSISYANALASYVSVSNQPFSQDSKGRAYGIQWFAQYRLKNGFYGQVNINYIRSLFSNLIKPGVLSPSVWDPGFFSTLSCGRIWGKGWQWGLRCRYSSGTPYSPFDLNASSRQAQWDLYQRGVYDFSLVNSKRLPGFYQIDMRIDKTYSFNNQSLNLFLDLSNLTAAPLPLLPYLTVQRDPENLPLPNPQKPGHYLMKEIPSDSGRPLPTLGLIWNF